jgi:hypothetical protein
MNLSMRHSLTLEDTPSVPVAGRPQPTIRQILDNLFRPVVADSFYGEDEGFKQKLGELGAGYVLAIKPTPAKLSQHKMGEIGSPWEATLAAG